MLRRTQINTEIQKQILIGLIVSTKFCTEIYPSLSSDYFLSPYAKKIVRWTKDYYEKYKLAPNIHIQDIYNSEKEKLDPEESELISSLLSSLSTKYEQMKAENFNVDYLLDSAIEFFKKRSLEIMSKRVSSLVELSKLEDAEELVRDYKKVAKVTSRWVDPFDPVFMEKVIESVDEEFFKFPGKLGEFIGNLQRGYLIGIMGPYKRGKTNWLLEFAIEGLLRGLKVVFISLEMSDTHVAKRIYKTLGAFGDEAGEYLYPCFDCRKNQDGSCSKKERSGNYGLIDTDGEKPAYTKSMKYKPCTYCREHGLFDYIPETWFVIEKRPKLTLGTLSKKVRSIKRMMGDGLRIKAYPAYEANLMDIRRDLDNLEYTENFIPDMIVTDYADILASEDRRVTGREQIDLTWKAHKNLAAKRNCLVVTGSQTNRKSVDKKRVQSTDVAEDIRKLAHVDGMMMLSQTEKEKGAKMMRISYVDRHGEFSELKQVMVLQNFTVGQVLLDSEIYRGGN